MSTAGPFLEAAIKVYDEFADYHDAQYTAAVQLTRVNRFIHAVRILLRNAEQVQFGGASGELARFNHGMLYKMLKDAERFSATKQASTQGGQNVALDQRSYRE